MHTQSSVQQPAAMARKTAADHRKQQQRILQQIDVNNHDECEKSCSVCLLLQHQGPLLQLHHIAMMMQAGSLRGRKA